MGLMMKSALERMLDTERMSIWDARRWPEMARRSSARPAATIGHRRPRNARRIVATDAQRRPSKAIWAS
jgi:hypothetical protein